MEFINRIDAAKIRKTIHLIRHGQTDYNKQNIIQGSGIDSNLNETGRLQAGLFYEAYRHKAYSRVYTSTLKRTIQSVETFIVKEKIPHTALNEFNEINWGIMEGRTSSPETSALYNSMVEKWKSGALDMTVEGGETPLDMYKRQVNGLQKLMQSQHEELVLICMHGRALRSFLCLLTGTPLSEMEKWNHSNLCLYELEFNGTLFDITRENDISHLEAL